MGYLVLILCLVPAIAGELRRGNSGFMDDDEETSKTSVSALGSVPGHLKAGLHFGKEVPHKISNGQTVNLREWNGCADGSKNWTVRAGTVYKRNADRSLTKEGKVLEAIADCGGPLPMDPEKDCSVDKVSSRLGNALDSYFLGCAKQAAQKAGVKSPGRIFIVTAESFIDRKMRQSSSISQHALGNAVDIYSVQLLDEKGKAYAEFDAHIKKHFPDQLPAKVRDKLKSCPKEQPRPFQNQKPEAQRAFYDELRLCWSQKGGRSFGYQNPKGLPFGIRGSNNALHDDHLHFEY